LRNSLASAALRAIAHILAITLDEIEGMELSAATFAPTVLHWSSSFCRIGHINANVVRTIYEPEASGAQESA
jgi:hypothetical protein